MVTVWILVGAFVSLLGMIIFAFGKFDEEPATERVGAALFLGGLLWPLALPVALVAMIVVAIKTLIGGFLESTAKARKMKQADRLAMKDNSELL